MDVIKNIHVDRRTLPKRTDVEDGFEARQIVDLEIARVFTIYRALTIKSENGKRLMALFPDGLKTPNPIRRIGEGQRCSYVDLPGNSLWARTELFHRTIFNLIERCQYSQF